MSEIAKLSEKKKRKMWVKSRGARHVSPLRDTQKYRDSMTTGCIVSLQIIAHVNQRSKDVDCPFINKNSRTE